MREIIDQYNDPTRHQRMTVDLIHKYWHQELDDFSLIEKLSLRMFGTGDDRSISMLLHKFIMRGELKAYKLAHPDCEPLSTEDLKKPLVRARSGGFFIGKDELAIFLLHNEEELPAFWYTKDDLHRYQSILDNSTSDENISLLEKLETALQENKQLKKQLDQGNLLWMYVIHSIQRNLKRRFRSGWNTMPIPTWLKPPEKPRVL